MKHIAILLFAVALGLAAAPAPAQSLVVYADPAFNTALQEIAPLFSEHTGFEIQLTLAPSAILADQIREGANADLFFPAGEEYMRRAMEKGRVDVALKRNILSLPAPESDDPNAPTDPQYTSAAVLNDAEHRLQAMAFLEFLASPAARDVFARQGFGLP